MEFLEGGSAAGIGGFPGPVFDIPGARAQTGEETPAIKRSDLERVHSASFIASLYEGGDLGAHELSSLEKALLETYELCDDQGRLYRYEPERAVKPLAALFDVILAHVEGAYLACRLALAGKPGFCYYLGGGMHHARYDRGSGFCLVNDVAIAAFKVLAEGPAKSLWVIDLDAHKGDGTAELVRFARDRGDIKRIGDRPPPGDVRRIGDTSPSGDVKRTQNTPPPGAEKCILTLSVHMARGWPLDPESLAKAEPGRAPLTPSDIDIGIDSGEEAEYIPRLEEGIAELERLSAASGCGKPDLILVVDGADPYEHDGLPSSGLLRLSLEQCLRRDMLVYRYAAEGGIPSAWIEAGGYGERAWEPSAHFLRGIGKR
jgi:acetoin utilization deacetylase AcuC-like enzyme